jgi:hypothetical protein
MDLIKLVLSVTAPVETRTGESTIHLDPDATPVEYPPGKIPLALHTRLKKELESMEHSDIITKVTELADLMVEKPCTGKLRVCLHPET